MSDTPRGRRDGTVLDMVARRQPDPVVEAYKKDVDRTLIRENLKLTVDERVRKMIAALQLVEELRRGRGARR